MPTYDYACEECTHTFETFHSMNDAPLRMCPKCGKPALKRLIGLGAGLIFKGSGFYETDYKKKNGVDSSPAPSAPAEKKSGGCCSGSCACAASN